MNFNTDHTSTKRKLSNGGEKKSKRYVKRKDQKVERETHASEKLNKQLLNQVEFFDNKFGTTVTNRTVWQHERTSKSFTSLKLISKTTTWHESFHVQN